MPTSAAVLCLALLAPLAALAQSAVHSVWQGNGAQDNGTSWTIEITIFQDGTANITYPSLRCGGRLDFLGHAADGTSPTYREVLTFGKGACIDQGTVLLQPQADTTMGYLWYYPDNPAAPGATGTVSRVR